MMECLISEVCQFEYGKALKKENRNETGKYPVYGSNGIVGYHDQFLIKAPAIIVGRKGAAGEVHYANENLWPIDTTYFVLPKRDDLNLKFLFYQLKALRLQSLDKSTAIPGLNRNDAYSKSFYFPSFEEQKQIVSKIEELFSELDKSIEQLKTAQQQLKVYRQSVLKWAFEEKLTNENVKDGELPACWKVKSLIDVCEKIQDGSHFSPKNQYYEKADNRFLYITAKNIRTNYMDLSNVVYVDKEFHESIFQRCNPEYGDVLLTKDGANTGDVTLNILREPFSLLSSVCLLKTKREHLTPAFLKYYIQSPIGNKNIIGEMTGTAIKRIILRRIKEAEIIIPPTKEQELIVQEIESRFSVADKLEETITNSLQQAEALRQSILKKAFEGKLIQQKVYKPKKIYFYQTQTIAYLNYYSNKYGVKHGEMTLAKYAYLIDKLYDVPTYYKYERWHLGPYPPEIKKVVNNKNFFKLNKGNIEIVNSEKLFSYNNPYKQQVENAVEDLAKMFSKYPEKERSRKTELLATICKVIEDIKSDDLLEIRKSMEEWKIDLPASKFKNKAEKFTREETANCLKFVIEKGWNKQLLNSEIYNRQKH